MWWLLTLLPLGEWVEAWVELKKKFSVNHFWTAVARGLLMIFIGIILVMVGDTVFWWQGTLLSFAIFFAFFNYGYNLFTGRPLNYLRKEGIDGWEDEHIPLIARWFIRAVLLGTAIQIYIKPFILWESYQHLQKLY